MSSNGYQEDRELIQSCVKGGEDAWCVFKQKYDRLIRATVRCTAQRLDIPEYEVEDLASNVYEKLFVNNAERLHHWRGQARLSTYLVQITRNLCTDYARVRLRHRPVDHSSGILKQMASPSEAPEDADRQVLLEALHDEIERLSSQQALILKMRIGGATLREIADVLRLPVGTVSVYNSRAMTLLRERLGRWQGINSQAPALGKETP